MWFINDVWVVSTEGGAARRLTRSRGLANLPVWSPDGAFIAYIGHEQGKESLGHTGHVCVIAASGGAPRILTTALDRPAIAPPIFPATTLVWTPDGRGLYFIAMDRGNMPIFYADLDGTVRTVVGGERQVTGLTLTADGERLAFTAMHPMSPTDVYLVQTSGDEEQRLTDANRELLAEIELGQTERMTWQGADGWDIEGWVLRPPRFAPGRRYPTVLEIHGGPHGQYGNQFDPGWHALAGAGYLVIYANPRGSTGYGEPFTLACVNDWGGNDAEDLLRGVDAVVAHGWADPDRLGVSGYSYGGFMTSWLVGHTQRFHAAVVGAPVSNAYSFWGTSDIGPQFGHYEFGSQLPQEAPDHYLAGSPVHHLVRCETPVLLLHHEGDLRCPIGQSEEMFAVLKKLGKEVVMVRYPGGFHRYVTHAPSQQVDAMRRTAAWFERFLNA
jgi:dipeptidyl aminopeptidase/acylaminoacyl peptidase